MHEQFDSIKKQMQHMSNIKKSITHKLDHLKQIYNEMVKSNNNKKIFLICLESFHFQYKVFNVELNNLERLYLLLTNRTYYDYCCTYNLLHKHFIEYGISVPTIEMHKPYKDLEPFAEYELEDIYLVHKNTVELLEGLKLRHNENDTAIAIYKSKMLTGIHISSFIHTLEYDNNVLKDQICLYESYFAFYYESQFKYFTGLLTKMKTFCSHIDAEIKLPIQEDDTVTQVSDDPCINQIEEPVGAEGAFEPVGAEGALDPVGAEGALEPKVEEPKTKVEPANITIEIKKEDTFSETSSESSAKKPRKKRVAKPAQ